MRGDRRRSADPSKPISALEDQGEVSLVETGGSGGGVSERAGQEGEKDGCVEGSYCVPVGESESQVSHHFPSAWMLNWRRVLRDSQEIMLSNVRMMMDSNDGGPLCMRAFLDGGQIDTLPDDARPLSKTCRLRNRMLDSLNISQWDYILWIDSDVVEYPTDLAWQLIEANPGGVTAPLVLIEEPGPTGPNQFYDTTAFTLKGRANHDPDNNQPFVEGRSVSMFRPYIPNATQDVLQDVDGVGTVYVMPASLFADGSVRYEDHARLTEHWCRQHPNPIPFLHS